MVLEVFKGESDIWFVRLAGGNGETLMVSEGYDNKRNAVRAAENIAKEWNSLWVVYVDVLEDDD